MIEDLKLKNYAPGTRAQYVACAKRFAAFHMRSPAELGEREIRDFLLALVFERATVEKLKMHVAALKFLYGTTLRRPEEIVALPWPKVPHRLPDILSGTEVERLIAAIEPLLHRAVVMAAYGSGLRIKEASLSSRRRHRQQAEAHSCARREARTRPLRAAARPAAGLPARVLAAGVGSRHGPPSD
ncbi:MAG: phage integrase N-terminal SAM-like domain-containing protein [Sphingosinicella sp.]|uniref:phage integrase N-terminal SAM-like domain-containing protein n=1 Tax=Sphingosinicella sp. TaxID=1917971 RepID=UPI0040377723